MIAGSVNFFSKTHQRIQWSPVEPQDDHEWHPEAWRRFRLGASSFSSFVPEFSAPRRAGVQPAHGLLQLSGVDQMKKTPPALCRSFEEMRRSGLMHHRYTKPSDHVLLRHMWSGNAAAVRDEESDGLFTSEGLATSCGSVVAGAELHSDSPLPVMLNMQHMSEAGEAAVYLRSCFVELQLPDESTI